MVDIEAKICNFCKTPFKEGRYAPLPIPKKSFTPPQVVIKVPQLPVNTDAEVNSEPENITENQLVDLDPVAYSNRKNAESIISRVKPANIAELYKDIRNPKHNTLDVSLDALGFVEEELDFKELKKRVPQSIIVNETEAREGLRPSPKIPSITRQQKNSVGTQSTLNINKPEKPVIPVVQKPLIQVPVTEKKLPAIPAIKDRAKRYSEKLVLEDPFARIPFEIDALEIAEIKDAPTLEVQEAGKANSVDVDPESLKEINDLARLLSPISEVIEEEKVSTISLPNENNKFERNNVLRVSDKQIIEQKTPEPPSKSIRNVVDALESVQDNNVVSERLKRYSKRIDFEDPFIKELFEPDTLEMDDFKKIHGTKNEIIIEEINIEPIKVEFVIDGNITASEIESDTDMGTLPSSKQERRNNSSDRRSTTNSQAMNHYNSAKNYCVKGNYQKALEELEIAVKIDPAFEQAHILLSRTYLKLKSLS